MLDKIISYSFYLLFFLTPLFWTSLNYELFEFNKMILTYGFTVVIMGCWLLKTINDKRLTIKRTLLDIPLLLFLGANILSTIFSIDPHTSMFGYYSRSNGGLLSIIAYLLLYFAFVSNMSLPKVLTTLKFGLSSGFLISLWAIFEHFGFSASCVILRGEFNNSCWIQDVQARVFASLGQPNWLASYLAMLIFPALYFLLTTSTRLLHTTYYILLITMYLAFTFTYSRGPTLGLIVGMVVFILFILKLKIENYKSLPAASSGVSRRDKFVSSVHPQSLLRGILAQNKLIALVLGSFFIINILFGSALTSFRLVSKFAAPVRPAISLPATTSGTQLENGGTESGQIRFIVWQGAFDIFKANPIFGSGVETFAYSYYQYRPASHNLTSEWDFLYNKAHNEYLNYLATTGIVGFVTYILVIGTFLIFCIKYYVSALKQKKHNTFYLILTTSLLASYVSYLIYNFFLFSVVIIAIFFYLFPALVLVATGSAKDLKLNLSFFSWITKNSFYTKAAKGVVIFATFYLLFSIFKLWYADTLFNRGQTASDLGSPGRAYNLLAAASELNSNEPLYKSELAYSAAAASSALKDTDATLSAELKDESLVHLRKTLRISPKNVSFWRTAIRTYFELSSLDKKYITDTLKTLDYTITLAPTDPKLYYNKALILDLMGKKDEEIEILKKAIQLKPDYPEALSQLKEATEAAK